MNHFCAAMLFVGALSSATFGQTVIVDDDFEGYADEAALHAVWAGNPPASQMAVEDSMDLTVEAGGINADFNGDGTVDAADYPVWRKNNGAQADYDAWTAQFGGPPSGGGPANTYVFRELGPGDPPTPSVAGNLQYTQPLDPNFLDGSIFPSQGLEPIVLRGDIFTPSTALGRSTIGLRSNSPANIWEMGIYNDGNANPPAPPGTTGAATHGNELPTGQNVAFALFALRVQLFAGSNPNWLFFAMDPLWDTNGNGLVTAFEAFTALGISEGWHTMEATFEPVEGGASGDVFITATLDLLADGMNNAQNTPGVDGTITIEGLQVSQVGFDSLRFGGPSQLSSAAASGFDNIVLTGPLVPPPGAGSLSAVPEPTTAGLALLAIAGLMLGRRRN
ncbi:MAG: PEP-CTERM sorting domain-containing protein [Pirellulales bacterium]